MSSDISTVYNIRNYEYFRKFIKNYKPLRSGNETLFSRRKKYYRYKLFDEIRNFNEDEKKRWEAEFYCRELEKLTKYYYIIDDLKNNKDFQLEINVELLINLIKRDYKEGYNEFVSFSQCVDIEQFYEHFDYIDIYISSSILYLTLIFLLSFLLEKDIREIKNIECLKSMYYVIGRERCTIFSVYKMINWIYKHIFIDNFRFFDPRRGGYQQITPEGIYDRIHDFLEGVDKFFIRNFVDHLQYLED